MKSTLRSGNRRSVFKTSARSAGGPQIPLPTTRIAPKPRRLTSKAPPMRKRPDSAALVMGSLREFFGKRGQGQLASGGIEDKIEVKLPPVFKPKIVPRS